MLWVLYHIFFFKAGVDFARALHLAICISKLNFWPGFAFLVRIWSVTTVCWPGGSGAGAVWPDLHMASSWRSRLTVVGEVAGAGGATLGPHPNLMLPSIRVGDRLACGRGHPGPRSAVPLGRVRCSLRRPVLEGAQPSCLRPLSSASPHAAL